MKGSILVCAALTIALLMCSGQAAAEIDPDTILGIWLLDEGQGDTAKDDSGNGYDGTLENAPEWVGGQFGNALLFDGASTYVNCGNPAAFNTDLFSVSFWCNIPATQGWNHMISRGQHVASGDPGSVNWGVMMYSAQETILYETFNDTGWVGITAATTTNEWHHVVATFDGATMQLYHDGALAASGSNGMLLDETRWFLIGARADAGAAGGFFNGSLDEVGYFNAVLSVEDIETIMNNGLSIVVAGTAEAADPVPANGDTDVPRDGILSWTPGMYAQTHDVYLGTSLDDVAAAGTSDPRDVLLAQGLAETSIDHGRLEFDQTYYWRVDEVNGAPDYSVYKGDVWAFTTEPLAYPIQGVTATSNTSSEAGQGPGRLVDGSGLNANDEHSTRTGDMWAGTPNSTGASYVQFAFDGVYKLHEMLVWNYNFEFEMFLGFGVKEATVAYSMDGVDWTMPRGQVELAQAPGLGTYATPTVIPMGGVAARYVRLTIDSAWSPTATQYGLSEVRFMYIAAHPREPYPADGATGVWPDAALSWRPGRGAGQHEVYLGTDAAALDMVDTTTDSLYNPALDLDTTYYWQIVEVNEAEAVTSWAGDVWSFTTQEYIGVDSFESYIDDPGAGDVIWEIWIDGWVEEGGDPDNGGSVVGHNTAPFAEQTIVHGGRQSMPLYFENASASGISEVDRTFSPAQDWAVNGIQSLSLWFYGAQGNAGRLYAKINDVKVTYQGDAGDIAKAAWQPWNIDLTTLGNVSNVATLSIGVEGTGSGVVYVDDIRLYAKPAELITPVEPDAANLVGSWAFDGDLTDGSGNGHNGTTVGDGITYENDAARGQVLSLPGGDDIYVSIGAVGISGNMPRTIGCWAKADNTSIPDWTLIFGFTGKTEEDGSGGNGSHFNIGSLGGPGGVGAHVWGWEETIFSDEEALEWHHYAMSYDGTTIRYYGDGRPMDTDPAKSNVQDLSISGDRVHVGSRITQASSFPGLVDDAVIYGVQLTDGEVAWIAGYRAAVYKPF